MTPAMSAATEILDAGPAGIAKAADLLRAGKPVAFPTETVYGLGADATDARAAARLFEIKGRPRFNPLIVHLAEAEAAEALALFDRRAEQLAEQLWPGPLTLVLPRRPDGPLALLVSAGLDTVAVRVPAHPVARRLLRAAGLPVAAPSANRSGAVSPTDPRHVLDDLGGRIPLILAGGRSPVGVESTVIDLTGPEPVLLRPGGVPREAIEGRIGRLADPPAPHGGEAAPRSPGRLPSHYAPSVPVRLEAREVRRGEALLAFGPDLRKGEHVLNLSEEGDLTEAAANLFAMLRALDRPGVTAIAVSPIPEEGLGEAINDRLRRAAAGRGDGR
jgi:L-threonylcarbamoyladenylate synthase